MAARKRLGQAEKRERTRQELLRAARSVFGQRGYHAASLEEIADEAGYSRGALYYNFPTKGSLFLALLDERIDERIRDIEETFAAGGWDEQTIRAQAQGAGMRAFESVKHNTEWRSLFFEFVAHAARDPEFARKFAQRKRKIQDVVAEIARERAAAFGVELPLSADEFAIAINAIGNGLAVEEIAEPNSVPDDLYGRLILLMLGVGVPTPAKRSTSQRPRKRVRTGGT